MKRLTHVIFVAALCLGFSGGPFGLHAQDVTTEEIEVVAKEAPDVDTIEEDVASYPLKPPDTSSPRATLQGFLDNMNRAYRVLMAAHRKNLKTPGFFAADETLQMARDAKILFERSVSCLDLHQIPQALRENVGYEGALKLKEIFDRIELPPLEQIPDLEQIEEMEEHEESPEAFRWRVPNTTIAIARVEEGARQGEFLFTPQTVARLHRFYQMVENLPYKTDSFVTHDFLDFYTSTPGQMLPPKWSQWLPAWTTIRHLGLAVWQWGFLLLLLALTFLFLKTLFHRFRTQAPRLSTAGQLWRWALFALVTSWILVALEHVLATQINITGVVIAVVRSAGAVIFWFLSAIAFFLGGRATAETLIASPKIEPDSFQASYLRAIFWVLGFLSAAIIAIYGLSQVGVSLAPFSPVSVSAGLPLLWRPDRRSKISSAALLFLRIGRTKSASVSRCWDTTARSKQSACAPPGSGF